jgi:OOP family OmpA-OmpF porin
MLAPTRGLAADTDCRTFALGNGERASYDPFLVFFDWDSAAITPQTGAVLDNVARVYAPLVRCVVEVASHADRSGHADYNVALSRRRAEAIAAYLAGKGVTAPIRIEGFGETRPLVETPDGTREPQNRRAEIFVAAPHRP